MAEGFELSHVKTGASGVIPAPIETVWSLVRVFANIGQWLLQDDFVSLHSELMVRLILRGGKSTTFCLVAPAPQRCTDRKPIGRPSFPAHNSMLRAAWAPGRTDRLLQDKHLGRAELCGGLGRAG